MTEKQRPDITQNVFPNFDIIPHPIRRIGNALLGLVTMHQLSPVSDHFPEAQGADTMLLGESDASQS